MASGPNIILDFIYPFYPMMNREWIITKLKNRYKESRISLPFRGYKLTIPVRFFGDLDEEMELGEPEHGYCVGERGVMRGSVLR